MGIFDERIQSLKKYKPALTRKPDFERFWNMALEELFPGHQDNPETDSEVLPEELCVSFELDLSDFAYPIPKVKVYKASLEASDGTVLRGWYLCPADAGKTEKVPGLVRFHGYSSNKGKVSELLLWALQGYAILAMDVRGQCGDTPDARVYSSGSFSGWLTLGIESPMEYYYRQVFLDCVQIIETLARRSEVDAERIALFGNSQGAALATASAALITKYSKKFPDLQSKVSAVSAGIPFLCDMKRAYLEHSDGPWAEFDWYFRMYDPYHDREDKIFECLSYFDAMNFAPWVECPVLLSVGLKDTACPPATIFALYNHLAGQKEIISYPDYGHESNDYFTDLQIPFFAQKLGLDGM